MHEDERGERGAIVHRLARRVAGRQRHPAGTERHEVPHADELAKLRGRQAGIDEELLEGDGLLAIGGFREVGRNTDHHAVELAAAVDDDLLAEQDARVEAADRRDAEEAFLHLGHHEGDLVHVRGDHERRPLPGTRGRLPLPAAQRHEVPGGVHAHFVRERGEQPADCLTDLALVPGRSACLRQLSHQGAGFHAAEDSRGLPRW